MVNGVSSDTAAKSAKDVRLPVGLHLNLTEGRPLTDAPHIVDEQGYLLYKMKFWYHEKTPQVLADIARETRAQLEKFKDLMGYYPTRVDGHQHVHIARHVPETIAPLLQEFGVTPDSESKDAFDSDPGRLREYHVLKSVARKYTLVDWSTIK